MTDTPNDTNAETPEPKVGLQLAVSTLAEWLEREVKGHMDEAYREIGDPFEAGKETGIAIGLREAAKRIREALEAC